MLVLAIGMHTQSMLYKMVGIFIRESIDYLCSDGADTPMLPYTEKTCLHKQYLSLFRYLIMV